MNQNWSIRQLATILLLPNLIPHVLSLSDKSYKTASGIPESSVTMLRFTTAQRYHYWSQAQDYAKHQTSDETACSRFTGDWPMIERQLSCPPTKCCHQSSPCSRRIPPDPQTHQETFTKNLARVHS